MQSLYDETDKTQMACVWFQILMFMEHRYLHYGVLALQNIFKSVSLLALLIPSLPAAFVLQLKYRLIIISVVLTIIKLLTNQIRVIQFVGLILKPAVI